MRELSIHSDLRHLADFISIAGLSSSFPKENDKVSLPFALAIIFGAKPHDASDDYDDLIECVSGVHRKRFVMCWDAIELEVEKDIVEWSQSVSTEAVVHRLHQLAAAIEHSNIF